MSVCLLTESSAIRHGWGVIDVKKMQFTMGI